MPEPGEIVTTTRISGIDSIIQMLGSLMAAVMRLEGKVDVMTDALADFKADVASSFDNIATGVQSLIDRLDAALADNQANIDAALADQLTAIKADLQPIADQARSLAEATPDAPPPGP